MKNEIEKLKEEIWVLESAIQVMDREGWDTFHVKQTLSVLKEKTATPQIKDGVLGREIDPDSYHVNVNIMTYEYFKNKPKKKGVTFLPLTIEELLPTLAQWVPGAVRWRYTYQDTIVLYDSYNNPASFSIPAPPRDDWKQIGGEL